MRFLSVCSGIDVASIAWRPLGWEPVLLSEVEAFPREVCRVRHDARDARKTRPAGALPLWGDFTALRMRHLRRLGIDPADIDVLVGGTPCQGFSVAGLRGSLSDPRGGLSLAFLRLAHAIQSVRARAGKSGLIVVWENVPGVLSTDDNALGCFLGALVGADDAVLPSERPARGRSNKLWRWRAAGRWPVLDDDGNETGDFVERSETQTPCWPAAGMVAGPRARAAWRVLDAQHFGLAQRRARVFLVAGLGDGLDPATVLFEPQGLCGDPAPGGEAPENVAPTLAGGARSSGGYSTDDVPLTAVALRGQPNASFRADSDTYVPVAFGGNRQSGPIDIATAVNAHGGPHGRLDFETETFVIAPQLAGTLRAASFDASEDGSGRQPALIVIDCKAGGETGFSIGALPGALRGEGHAGGHAAIAFSCKDHGADAGRLAPALRAMNFDGSHANGGGQVAVAIPILESGKRTGASSTSLKAGDGIGADGDPMFTLGTDSRHAVGVMSGVRRLMPVECERLQGVPDHFTRIPWRGRPAEDCPDGPRYRALGNAYPRPVLEWIGRRIVNAAQALPILQAAE